MRVIVVHNPTAGENDVTKDALLAALRDAGHDPVYHSTKEADLAARVQETGDVLLAAGGDGTVRKVALSVGDARTPIVVVPLGTANNVAKMLGMPDDPIGIASSLASFREIPFDIGAVRSEWGRKRFIEAVGFGVFAETMAVAKTHAKHEIARDLGAEAEILRDVRLLKALLSLHKPSVCRVELAGGEVLEDALLLVEVMNIGSIGPNLRFAPDAEPGDGLFDVVLAPETARAELAAYLEERLAGRNAVASGLVRRRTDDVRITWRTPLAHVDDKRWAADDGVAGPHVFEVGIERGARRFLVP